MAGAKARDKGPGKMPEPASASPTINKKATETTTASSSAPVTSAQTSTNDSATKPAASQPPKKRITGSKASKKRTLGAEGQSSGNEKRKKRVDLSNSQKDEILQALKEQGLSTTQLSAKYGVHVRTIQRWAKLSPDTQEFKLTAPRSDGKHTKVSVKFPELEKAVKDLVMLSRREKLPITRSRLREQGLRFAKAMGINSEEFKASDRWVKQFVKRHQLSARSLKEESEGTGPTPDIAAAVQELRKDLQRYAPENVYKMEEVGIFYRLLPKEVYVSSAEDGKKSVQAAGTMLPNDRISVLCCTNATGTHKVPLCVTGTAKKPMGGSLEEKTLVNEVGVQYWSQESPWVDPETVERWVKEIFLPSVESIKSRPAGPLALIMESAETPSNKHTESRGDEGEDEEGTEEVKGRKAAPLSFQGVDVFFLPQNPHSTYQPADQGIAGSTKLCFRYRLIEAWSPIFLHGPLLQRTSSAVPEELRGLPEGYHPNLLDALQLLRKVWEEDITDLVLSRCWQKYNLVAPKPVEPPKPAPIVPKKRGPGRPPKAEGSKSKPKVQTPPKTVYMPPRPTDTFVPRVVSNVLDLLLEVQFDAGWNLQHLERRGLDPHVISCLRAVGRNSDRPRKRQDLYRSRSSEEIVRAWLFVEEDPEVREALLEDGAKAIEEEVGKRKEVLKEAEGKESNEGALDKSRPAVDHGSSTRSGDAHQPTPRYSVPLREEVEHALRALQPLEMCLHRVGADDALRALSRIKCNLVVRHSQSLKQHEISSVTSAQV